MNEFTLDKWIWTEADFETMGWHDCKIYSFCVDEARSLFLLDIDYIFQWVKSQESQYYKFWIAPATLVFENVHNLQMSLECSSMKIGVMDLQKKECKKPINSSFIKKDVEWKWVFDTQEGEISLWSVGFKQYIRKTPVLSDSQYFGLEQRGGVCFSLDIAN